MKSNLTFKELCVLVSPFMLRNTDDFSKNQKEFISKLIDRDLNKREEKLQKSEKNKLNDILFDLISKELEQEGITKEGMIHLDLRNQKKRNVKKLSGSLKRTKYLSQLSLFIDGESMKIIHKAIRSNQSIKKLQVGDMDDDIAAYFLSKALKYNNCIEEIVFYPVDLSFSHPTSKYLYKFLKKNKSIKTMKNFFEVDVNQSMKYFMKHLKKMTLLSTLIFLRAFF